MDVRYAALIRGINVGKAKRVAMADLRALAESLGARDAATLLNSGNLVFTAPKGKLSGPALQAAMAERLGVSAKVVLLDATEVQAVLAANPLDCPDPARFLVAVTERPEDLARLAPLAERDWAPDRLALGARAAYLRCDTGILDSPLLAAVNKALKDSVTTRNWATFGKLAGMM